MSRKNGKSEGEAQELDVEHELPASVGEDERGNPSAESELREAETLKLKAERDSLIDRLARLQAEFENARRRASREQQDFREFAAADTIRTLLPVLDSFDRALRFTKPLKWSIPRMPMTIPYLMSYSVATN
jgi:molecular chaperone GrpE